MNSDRKFKPLTSCSLSQLSLTSCELFKFFFSRFSSPSSPPAQLQLLLLTPYFLPSSVLRQQHQELPIRTVFFLLLRFFVDPEEPRLHVGSAMVHNSLLPSSSVAGQWYSYPTI